MRASWARVSWGPPGADSQRCWVAPLSRSGGECKAGKKLSAVPGSSARRASIRAGIMINSFAAAAPAVQRFAGGRQEGLHESLSRTHRQARPVRRPDSRRPLPQKCCPFQIPFSLSLLYRPPSPHIRSLSHTCTGPDPVVEVPSPASSCAGFRGRQLRSCNDRKQREPATPTNPPITSSSRGLTTGRASVDTATATPVIIHAVIDSRSLCTAAALLS